MKKFLIRDELNKTTEFNSYGPGDFVKTNPGKESPVLTKEDGYLDESLIKGAKTIMSSVVYGEEISAMKMIYIGEDSKAYMARCDGSYRTAKTTGMTTQAGEAGQVRPYVLFGEISDTSFNFPWNMDLFLSEDGNISLTPPQTGFQVSVGQSLEAGKIFLTIEKPIEL